MCVRRSVRYSCRLILQGFSPLNSFLSLSKQKLLQSLYLFSLFALRVLLRTRYDTVTHSSTVTQNRRAELTREEKNAPDHLYTLKITTAIMTIIINNNYDIYNTVPARFITYCIILNTLIARDWHYYIRWYFSVTLCWIKIFSVISGLTVKVLNNIANTYTCRKFVGNILVLVGNIIWRYYINILLEFDSSVMYLS